MSQPLVGVTLEDVASHLRSVLSSTMNMLGQLVAAGAKPVPIVMPPVPVVDPPVVEPVAQPAPVVEQPASPPSVATAVSPPSDAPAPGDTSTPVSGTDAATPSAAQRLLDDLRAKMSALGAEFEAAEKAVVAEMTGA